MEPPMAFRVLNVTRAVVWARCWHCKCDFSVCICTIHTFPWQHPRPRKTWPVHRCLLLWWLCCPHRNTQLRLSGKVPSSARWLSSFCKGRRHTSSNIQTGPAADISALVACARLTKPWKRWMFSSIKRVPPLKQSRVNVLHTRSSSPLKKNASRCSHVGVKRKICFWSKCNHGHPLLLLRHPGAYSGGPGRANKTTI